MEARDENHATIRPIRRQVVGRAAVWMLCSRGRIVNPRTTPTTSLLPPREWDAVDFVGAESLAEEVVTAHRVEIERLREAATKVADAYTAEAEDHNDGEFALWKADDLVNAIVALRAALAKEDA